MTESSSKIKVSIFSKSISASDTTETVMTKAKDFIATMLACNFNQDQAEHVIKYDSFDYMSDLIKVSEQDLYCLNKTV